MKLVGTLLLFVATLSAPAQSADLAASRAHTLQHGINASMWFAQSVGHYDVQRLRTFTTEEDIREMHRLGFDHVRLSMDATPLLSWHRGEADGVAYMAEVDRVVSAMLDNHLAVILDLHPEDNYKKALQHGDDTAAAFVDLWSALAQHFADRDPEHVFFELMNEPEQGDGFRWRDLETRAIASIRTVAPGFTIIASALGWDGLHDLLEMQPLSDTNVIYTFHDYDPMIFTHQGATWTNMGLSALRNLPYPSTPDNVATAVAAEPSVPQQEWVQSYGLDQWNARRIDIEISFAAKWAARAQVPVYCGEFGSYGAYAPAASRARWIHDMRDALEKNNIGWAMWDYQTDFGVVKKTGGAAVPDNGIVQALGLHPVPALPGSSN